MSEEQRFGDGQDNYLQGMRQASEAARQFGSAAGGAGAAGAAGSAAGEAAANAAAATVKAGVEAGKAVSGIAAGTAVGGPWGAVLSAAWSLRHTLFKILIFICLFLLFIIIAVVSLPSIVFNNIFHTDPSTVDPNGPTEVSANFDDLSAVVSECIQAGYDAALARVDQIIADGGYDYELSMEALVNNALVSADYDTCYALAAYSASFSITYGEAILNMSNALKMTMYGTASDGSVPPISDAELNLFLASLDCSGKRKELMRCALSLVGRVPYFWGGKSAPGWNSEWNTPKLVTSAGSSSTGTIRPTGWTARGSRNGSIRRRLASPSTTGHGTSGMPPTPSPRRNCCPATWALWRCPAPSRSIMSCSMRARTPTEISSGSTAPAGQGWSSTHPIM